MSRTPFRAEYRSTRHRPRNVSLAHRLELVKPCATKSTRGSQDRRPLAALVLVLTAPVQWETAGQDRAPHSRPEGSTAAGTETPTPKPASGFPRPPAGAGKRERGLGEKLPTRHEPRQNTRPRHGQRSGNSASKKGPGARNATQRPRAGAARPRSPPQGGQAGGGPATAARNHGGHGERKGDPTQGSPQQTEGSPGGLRRQRAADGAGVGAPAQERPSGKAGGRLAGPWRRARRAAKARAGVGAPARKAFACA